MAKIIGDSGDNEITGTNQDDILKGLGGDDTFFGKRGDDKIYGGSGDDSYWSGRGNDLFNGGSGFDRAWYRDDPAAVIVDLKSGTAQDGWGGQDTLINVERVTGSAFDDTLLGSSGKDSFTGGLGNDTINGRGGWDFIWYGGAKGAVTVDLKAGTASGGEGNDTIVSIEGIAGSNYSDKLYGTNRKNVEEWFSLDSTGDQYTPHKNKGGADFVDGRGGKDGVFFQWERGGVTADLKKGTVLDSTGNTDTLKNIEMLSGSFFNDVLKGDNGSNYLGGEKGDDKLYARKGADELEGGEGKDTFYFRKKEGNNKINDFTNGDDKLNLKGFGFANKNAALAKFSETADGYALFVSNGTKIHLLDFAFSDLGNSDIII